MLTFINNIIYAYWEALLFHLKHREKKMWEIKVKLHCDSMNKSFLSWNKLRR